MNMQISDPDVTHVTRYDLPSDSILFYPENVSIQKEPISIYITTLRDTERQMLVGVQFNELRMMIMTLMTNGALSIGAPLSLNEVLCVARRMSGHAPCTDGLFKDLRRLVGSMHLAPDELEAILEYPMGWT